MYVLQFAPNSTPVELIPCLSKLLAQQNGVLLRSTSSHGPCATGWHFREQAIRSCHYLVRCTALAITSWCGVEEAAGRKMKEEWREESGKAIGTGWAAANRSRCSG